jgi:hypothetical protein
MRSRILPAVGISALALVAATAFAGGASAQHSSLHGVSHGKAGAVHYAHTAATCYSQGAALDGNGISSQNFEASFDQYDDMAADDFKAAADCKAKVVVVTGTDSGIGAASENVTFYKNAGGVPGAVIKSLTKKGTYSAGTYTIKLGKKGPKLPKGKTRWMSVQVNLDFSTGGQWFWSTATDGGGNDGQWQNPGNGFGTGCVTWCDATVAGATSPEFSFSISS